MAPASDAWHGIVYDKNAFKNMAKKLKTQVK
jgi:hypothetical protein